MSDTWSWSVTKDVEAFNAGLRAKAKGRIEARREKALSNKGIVSELRFPLRRREDATPTYVVPAVRKKPPFQRFPGKAAAAPEPELAMAQYEETTPRRLLHGCGPHRDRAGPHPSR